MIVHYFLTKKKLIFVVLFHVKNAIFIIIKIRIGHHNFQVEKVLIRGTQTI